MWIWKLTKIGPWIMAVLFGLISTVSRYREVKTSRDAKEAKGYAKTRKAGDDADTGSGDADADRKWLSARDPDKR